jgi:hypothetical protein
VIRLNVGTLQLDGMLLANGGNGNTFAGGGSGGSIFVKTRTLSGNGVVQANGGSGATQSGGGGGGRVAVYYGNAASFAFSNVVARGGTGFGVGVNGTVFLLQTNFAFADSGGALEIVAASLSVPAVR